MGVCASDEVLLEMKKTMEEKIDRLEKDVKTLQGETEKLRGSNENLEADLASERAKTKQQSGELDSLKAELKSTESERAKTISELKEALAEAEGRAEQAEVRIRQGAEKLQKLETDLSAELSLAQSNMERKSEDVVSLKKILAEEQKERARLDNLLSGNVLRDEYERLVKSETDLTASLKSANEKMKTLGRECAAMRVECNALEKTESLRRRLQKAEQLEKTRYEKHHKDQLMSFKKSQEHYKRRLTANSAMLEQIKQTLKTESASASAAREAAKRLKQELDVERSAQIHREEVLEAEGIAVVVGTPVIVSPVNSEPNSSHMSTSTGNGKEAKVRDKTATKKRVRRRRRPPPIPVHDRAKGSAAPGDDDEYEYDDEYDYEEDDDETLEFDVVGANNKDEGKSISQETLDEELDFRVETELGFIDDDVKGSGPEAQAPDSKGAAEVGLKGDAAQKDTNPVKIREKEENTGPHPLGQSTEFPVQVENDHTAN